MTIETSRLRVIGAGLPRTGTTSLKGALELLLGGRCYHMSEMFERGETDGVLWYRALSGDSAALDQVLQGWAAAVDWPASILWREVAARHPDATVILSHRGSAETWWQSADATVWERMRKPDIDPLFAAFNEKMRESAGFGDDWHTKTGAISRYRSHYDEVVAAVPTDRLLIWQPSDGWEPLCAALGVSVPSEPFFHRNDRAEFVQRAHEADSAS